MHTLYIITEQYLIHTYIHPFNGLCPGLPGSAGTRKVKPIWILLKQETVSGSGICKSASRSRQITTPALKFFTGRMPFLPPNQQRQSNEQYLNIIFNSCVRNSMLHGGETWLVRKQNEVAFQGDENGQMDVWR